MAPPHSPTLPPRPAVNSRLCHDFSALSTVEIAATPRLDHLPELRWGLRWRLWPVLRWRAHGNEDRRRRIGRSLYPAVAPSATALTYLNNSSGLTIRSRLQREFHRLPIRRKLRRPDQGRPGSHCGLLVRLLQGRLWPRCAWACSTLTPCAKAGRASGFHGIRRRRPKGTDNMFWTSFRYYLP